MRRMLHLLRDKNETQRILVSLITAFLLLPSLPSVASTNGEEIMYIYFKDGSIEAFPMNWITSQSTSGGVMRINVDGNFYSYNTQNIDSTSLNPPTNYPTLTSFKFNNKYNDQLFTDTEGVLEGEKVTATVGAIGKWLTPSYQLSSDDAIASVNGTVVNSKKSRINFSDDVTFSVSNPRQTVLDRKKVSDAIYSTPEKYITTKIQLTEEMVSTNAPTNPGEGIGMMLDGDLSTYFHPSNGDDTSADNPYIDIHLDEAMSMVQFGYTLRKDLSRYPKEISFYVSNDGTTWTLKEKFNRDSGLPYKTGASFTSPVIDLGGAYSYFRILQTQASYKKNLFFVEFEFSKITENPDTIPILIQPDIYEYFMVPFGRDYQIHVDWLTDQSENVPRIDIDIEDGKFVNSKDYYLNANITIDGAGVYPSMSDKVQIKGRGNSSWSNNSWAKNPYRLKFEEKVKPFGLTKGKNWVLLANKQDGSMMTNALGMKIAGVVGTAGYNHIIPVELYINGVYWGSYNFTEKVGFHNNSIDVEDEANAALLELDSYYDEEYRFHSDVYYLPVNIKEPDLNETGSNLDFSIIKDDFNAFVNALSKGEDVEKWVDVDYLARYLMVNDLICNYEINHPKSTFLYKENFLDGGKYIFGPVWDLDWAFGYEHGKTYGKSDILSDFYQTSSMECKEFIYDLRYVCEAVDKAYYKVWTLFMQNHLQEVLDYCDEYYEYAKPSFEHDYQYNWWSGGADYSEISSNMRQWLKKRAENIYANLKPYDISDDEQPDGIEVIPSHETNTPSLVDVYDISGVRVKSKVPVMELRRHLSPGLYIVNGKKMVVK